MIKKIKEDLKINQSFDTGYRYYSINNTEIYIFYIGSLFDQTNYLLVLDKILKINNINELKNNLLANQFFETNNYDLFINSILQGKIGIYINDINILNPYIILDLRSYETRSPQEPDTEKVVRGSRDGFVENIATNISLIRRRVRSKNLITKLYQIGIDSKTDVCLCYINDLCDLSLVKELDYKLSNLKIRELSMSDKALEEILIKQGFNPYPLVRYTERPDNVSSHLFQGLIAIIVDTSPSVILLPITVFDHLQHAEEYRQTPLVGTIIRFIRFFGILLSLFLVPIWYYLVSNNINIPFLKINDKGNISIFLQLIFAEAGIEFLRMAAIHTPNPLSTAMGLIAGILVGDIAVKVGLFIPEIVLYVAISQIGSYLTPSYELSLANKISKFLFLIATHFFKLTGLIISILIWLIYLANLKSFNKPYLYPLYPFNLKELLKIIIRLPKDK